MIDVILKRFETPDETRPMTKGRFDLVHLGGMTIGRAAYEPGWRWSEHVGPATGVSFDDGTTLELRAGALFHIPAIPHDSWVIGDTPYVSLHFLGADRYAR